MIYLLYGIQNYLINEQIKEIIKKSKVDKYNIQEFDLEVNSLNEIIDAANTISLFSDNKVIIVNNSYIFSGQNKKSSEDEINKLTNYLDNVNQNTTLIFKLDTEKIDSRKKIVTKIKNSGTVIECNKPFNMEVKVSEMFKPYQINKNNITYFINRVGTDMNNISNEITKIKTYKDNDLIITIRDIDDLTIKHINTDIFYLIDNILNNNKDEALESYNEMLKIGEEPIKILVMLANQFRLIYQVKKLSKKGYREYDIGEILEQKPYTIKKAYERINKYKETELINYISSLAKLDVDIKSGNIDKNLGLELFILNIEKEI